MPEEVINNDAQGEQQVNPADVIKQQMEIAMSLHKPIAPTQATPAAAQNNEVEEFETVDPDEYVKQQLGFNNWDEAKAAFEEWNNLKKNPPKQADYTFANDESKRIHEALKAGKVDEVKKYLSVSEILSGVDTKTNEEKLKLYIQLNKPKFDKELVDDEYNDTYGVDETAYQNDEKGLRRAKLNAEQAIENDVKKAMDFFATYKQQIDLPDLTPPVDEGYVKYKQTLETLPQIAKEAKEDYSKMTESAIAQTFKFNDEANKLNVDFQFTPDPSTFKEAVEYALDEDKFYQQFFSQDGSPDRQKFLKFIYNGMYAEKMVTEALKQASNASRLAMINNATEGGSVKRNLTNVAEAEGDELTKHMQIALGRFQNGNGVRR